MQRVPRGYAERVPSGDRAREAAAGNLAGWRVPRRVPRGTGSRPGGYLEGTCRLPSSVFKRRCSGTPGVRGGG
eukprot:3932000-Rhodomonas_salina.1